MPFLRVAVCEDETPIREYLRRLVEQYAGAREIDCKVYLYENGTDLLKTREAFDIILMDYQLDYTGESNGMAIAKAIRETDRSVAIIFITNHPQIVFSAFEVNTFRFLVKPVDSHKLFQALDDYHKARDISGALLTKADAMVARYNFHEICYLEGEGKYCVLHLSENGTRVSCRETLASVGKRLPGFLFFRCHKSFIVNFAYVRSFSRREVFLIGGEKLPMGRKKFSEFQELFFHYIRQFIL